MLHPRAACTNIIFVRASNAEKHAIKKIMLLEICGDSSKLQRSIKACNGFLGDILIAVS